MGGMVFTVVSSGKTAKEAYDLAFAVALQEHGNQGYTGTIVEKDGFEEMPFPENYTGDTDYRNGIHEDHELVWFLGEDPKYQDTFDNKWGPAICIPLFAEDSITMKVTSTDVQNTPLPKDVQYEVAYRIDAIEAGNPYSETTTDLSYAKQVAKNCAVDDAQPATITQFMQVKDQSGVIYTATPRFTKQTNRKEIKTYLFTGVASC